MKNSPKKALYCKRHQQHQIRFICSMPKCSFQNLICDACMHSYPGHSQQHKNFIYPIQDFVQFSSQKSQKAFLSNLAQSLDEIFKKISEYNTHCDQELAEVDKDFGSLFKTFFSISEATKNFLKEHIKGENRKTMEKYKGLRQSLKILQDEKQKEKGFLTNLFTKDDEINKDENILKLIEKNAPLNRLRAETINLYSEVQILERNKVKYKKNDQAKNFYEEIRDQFERNCKEMYRQFKVFVDGGDEEDMKKSIFALKRSQSLQAQTITIDLSQGNSQSNNTNSCNTVNSSYSNLRQSEYFGTNKNPPYKKIAQFPDFKNPQVLKAIQIHGSLNLNTQDSYFNKIPEQGPFQYPDGSVYLGHLKDSKRHGRGKLLFVDGAYYEGYWKEDIPFGFGRFIRQNGDMYEGWCLNYKANGKGSFQSLDGYKYVGEWKDDKRQGQGEEFYPNGVEIKGNYEQGILGGKGSLKFPDGTIYEGDFDQGELSGSGTFNFFTGDKYYGEVKQGKKHGKGIYLWQDGRKYEGSFFDDSPDGQGIFWWPDGLIYKGQWKNGLQNGIGYEISEDENYERQGEWENGVWKKWIISEQVY